MQRPRADVVLALAFNIVSSREPSSAPTAVVLSVLQNEPQF